MSAIVPRETFAHGTAAFNFAAYPHTADSGFVAHWHDEWEIIHVRSGTFRFYADGRPFTLRENQALLIDRCAIHISAESEADGKDGYSCFVFGSRFLCPDPESHIYRRCFEAADSGAISLTQSITGETDWQREVLRHCRLLGRYSVRPEQNALSIQISLLSIFDILLREKAYAARPRGESVQNGLVRQALLHIRQSGPEPLKVSELATSLHISTDHLIRLFKATVGRTPKQYMQELRIQQAVSLMRQEPGLTVAEIARQSGFDDLNYFSRLFKKTAGLSPSRYRETVAEAEKTGSA